MKNPIHFSGLNGLRAIAAIAVLFSHTTQDLRQFGLDVFIFGQYPDGTPKTTLLSGFGVSIFFTLSGFLITYLLLKEKQEGGVDIKNFYIRRMLRIWPLYYAYLAASVATLFIFGIPFDGEPLLFYIFMLANMPFIFGHATGLVAHYWSLGVEEQFYSFWPWIVKRSRSLLMVTIVLAVCLFTLKGLFRLADIRWNEGSSSWPYLALHVTRFHCMLIGAIGAILYFRHNALFLKAVNNIWTQLLSWLVILLVTINHFHVASFLDNELVCLVTVFIIIGQIERTHRIVNLDTGLLNFLGKISYGLYVTHPLVILYLSKIIAFQDGAGAGAYVSVYAAVFAATIGVSFLSFRFFENKFLKMKERYSRVSSFAG